jgi:hypothetical protein
LAAGDWIMGAGLLDLWRNPKSYAYEGTKAANQARILSIRMKPRNVFAERGARLEVTGINELKAVQARLQIDIVSNSGEVVFWEEVDTRWGSGVSQLLKKQINTNALRGTHTVKARVTSKDGRVLTENEYAFDVFSRKDLQKPKARIAVLDTVGVLKGFLKRSGIDFSEFGQATALTTPVLVASTQSKTEAQRRRFAMLRRFAERGGTAIYLKATDRHFRRDASNQVQSATFPFSAQVEAAQGLWTCIPHLVRDHPIFAGLPVNSMMRDIYENVWARQTLRELDGEPLVASIGFQWFSHGHKLHYSGPGPSWWGSDLALVPLGRGRCIVSQLRIVESLNRDPVAQKILYNLIAFAAQQ